MNTKTIYRALASKVLAVATLEDCKYLAEDSLQTYYQREHDGCIFFTIKNEVLKNERRNPLRTQNQLNNLKEGTIVIQEYHNKSKDNSKFDINRKTGTFLVLVEQVGGKKIKWASGKKTRINSIRFTTRTRLYIGENWLQRLYKNKTFTKQSLKPLED